MSVATAPSSTPLKQTQVVFTTIDDVLAYLMSYRVQDFYARIISALPMREDKRVPMAAVTFERGHHVFLYNGEWVQKMLDSGKFGFEELRATIAHEAMHVVLTHIGRQMRLYRAYTDDKEKKRFLQISNVASDFAVNTLLLPERDVVHQGRYAYSSFYENEKEWALPKMAEMPEELSYEWYVTLLLNKKMCKECVKVAVAKGKMPDKCNHPGHGKGDGKGDGQGNMPGGGHVGGHDPFWVDMVEDLSDEEIEVLTTEIDGDAINIVKQAIEEHQKSRGTVPAHIQHQLDALLKPTPVPWRKLLHQFVTRCHLSRPTRSMERPRKRFLNLGSTFFPGRKRDRTFHVGFFVDVSGSMSDKDIETGLEELQGILAVNPDMQVTVAQFDTQIIGEPKDLTPRDDVSQMVRLGCGGTDFNQAFELAKEMEKKGRIDAIIIFTDGYAPGPEISYRPNHIPVLWCLTENSQHPCPGYGYEIRRPGRGERNYN